MNSAIRRSRERVGAVGRHRKPWHVSIPPARSTARRAALPGAGSRRLPHPGLRSSDDPQPVNLWEHLRDADEELTALAKLGDACAAFAEYEFEEFVRNYVDEPAKEAQCSTF